MLDEGWTDFQSLIFPSIDLPESEQWVEGSWPLHLKKGNITFATGVSKESTTVTIEEADGNYRVVYCPGSASGCKFSWWNEVEEMERKYKVPNMETRPIDWMEERALLVQS